MQSRHLLILAAAWPSLALAQPRTTAHPSAHAPARPVSAAPKSIGKFEDWQAATHEEAGQPVCYAFVRAASSQPVLLGRGEVVLTVTQRNGGRDAVAISAGFPFVPNAEVQMSVEQAQLAFYTAGRSAFARDGRAAVAAFAKAREAVAKAPGPRSTTVTDTFSLRGFSPAYAAINKACPAK